MEKITVRTTGDFELYDMYRQMTIPMKEDTEVTLNPFVEANLRLGKLKKVSGGPVKVESQEVTPVQAIDNTPAPRVASSSIKQRGRPRGR